MNFVNNNNRYRQNNRNNTPNKENHHHGNDHNRSDSPSSEPLISSEPIVKHTFKELKINLTNPDITPEQERKFRNLIDEFGDVFAVSNAELPGMDRLKFKIHINGRYFRAVAYERVYKTKVWKYHYSRLSIEL